METLQLLLPLIQFRWVPPGIDIGRIAISHVDTWTKTHLYWSLASIVTTGIEGLGQK